MKIEIEVYPLPNPRSDWRLLFLQKLNRFLETCELDDFALNKIASDGPLVQLTSVKAPQK